MIRKQLLFTLMLLPLLTGCIVAAAGAGGAGGYYISKEDAKDDKAASSPQANDDAAITAQVKNKFAQDTEIAAMNLDVDTYNNIVTLKGDAPNESVAERAINLAHGTDGVKGVRSEITIH